MKELDEQTALALLFGNTKRKRRTKDLISIAEACKYLVGVYGSQRILGEKVGLSSEMVREFLKILTLPQEVQEMIRCRKIDSIDVAYQISMLDTSKKQVEAAKQVADLQTNDVRDIRRLITSAGLSANESKKKILESKLRRFHLFIVDLDDTQYSAIVEQAKKRKANPSDLIKIVVLDWLERTKK